MDGTTKVYGSGKRAVTTLEDVSLEARAGEVILAMGPSGSGKTTLLTISGALLKPTRGKREPPGFHPPREGRLRLPELQPAGSPDSAGEHAAGSSPGTQNGTQPRDRAKELLAMLGLGHRLNSLPKHLSDGEKQRVAIARALAKTPALMLADEPTANLDAERGHEVVELLPQKALELNKSLIIVSHDQRIREVADRVVRLEDGRLRTDS